MTRNRGRRAGRRAGRHGLAAVACLFLTGCAPPGVVTLDEWTFMPIPTSARASVDPGPVGLRPAAARTPAAPRAILARGSGALIGQPVAERPVPDDGRGVMLNLVNTPVADAAKTVLGDILKVNYSLGGHFDGRITIQTATPVTRTDLIKLFQDALRGNGAAVVRDGDIYRIEPAETAAAGSMALTTAATPAPDLGVSRRVVQLRYIAASDMARILEPMAPKGTVVRADDAHNAVVLMGEGAAIADVLQAIAVFDVDTMKGMSVASVPVTAAPPDAIAADVRAMFGAGKDGAMSLLKLVPNARLKSILIISPQPAYLARAEAWIRKLDARAKGEAQQLLTYPVQNRTAKEFAGILNAILSRDPPRPSETQTSPRFDQARLQGGDSDPRATLAVAASLPANFDANAAPQGAATMPQPASNGGGSAASGPDAGAARVIADEDNNKIIILGSDTEARRILRIAQALDTAPNQVFIEATIAEVSLSDDLQFGLRYYFEGHGMRAGLTTGAAASDLGSVYPGFSWARTLADAHVTLNALNALTTVKVMSSPSLTVLDNHTATLQVGDQVPIVTQSATGVAVSGAPVVNSVSYRDTGVILSITPRVNDTGRVVLTIEQEVSSVANTTSSSIDSPTISQRRVKTTVALDDGEALTLGGLIQGQAADKRQQVPGLGDVPVLGALFRDKADARSRTELLVLLTPHVMHDRDDARAVTAEYRRKFDLGLPRMTRGPHAPTDTIGRAFE